MSLAFTAASLLSGAASACGRRGATACAQRSVGVSAVIGGGRGQGAQQPQQEAKEEADLTIEYRGRQAAAARGELLRTALLKAGLSPHNGAAQTINCRGLGTCGTCAVEVLGPVSLSERGPIERARLSLPPHSPPNNARLRLACQVRCEGDLKVYKRSKFWGQGDEVMEDITEDNASVLPLGELEFILDHLYQRKERN
eukprot:jgi/Chlat1/4454/Chrsp29S04402